MKTRTITIIGGGLAGLYMGLLLGKQGYSIDIYEYRPAIRQKSYGEGRSYNLTLYYRGIQAIKKIGLWEKVKNEAVQIEGDITHVSGKPLKFDPIEENGEAVLYTIHRSTLNTILLKELKKLPNVHVYFNSKLISIDKKNKTFSIQNTKTKKITSSQTDCIIGADGINSVTRSEMQRGIHASITQEHFPWGYKEVHISANKAKLLGLRLNTTHHWPAKKALLIAFPNNDQSFTFMFNLPMSGKDSFKSLQTKEDVKQYIRNIFPDLNPDADAIAEEFLKKRAGRFVTIYAEPWSYKDFIILIGDAAHGVIPFYGQGMCAAFEDCQILNDCMQNNKNWKRAFEQFYLIRKRNTDVLAYLSKQNFYELRNKSQAVYYSLRDTLDTILSDVFPNFWSPPLYRKIAHADAPYADAYADIVRQRKIIQYTGIDTGLYIFAIGISVMRAIKELVQNLLS